MSKLKKFLSNGLTIGIGATVIGALILDRINIVDWKSILVLIWGWIYSILIYKVAIWVFVVFLIILFIILVLIMYFQSKVEPKYLNYTEQEFQYFKWTWEWGNVWGKITPVNLRAHCPSCDTLLWYDKLGSYRCPRKDFSSTRSNSDNFVNIKSMIVDNARRITEGKKIIQ